ncbi:RHS repeat-associated core domain-containing protein, partial [Bacteroides gallinaceum]
RKLWYRLHSYKSSLTNLSNEIKTASKNITSIQYNSLNLPSKVTFKDGSTITYLYAADGTKLRTVHKTGSTATTTDYCGNVVYENGSQKYLLTEEGYVTLADNKYHYYLKDHQGNNRVVISSTGTVEETNHYYPFGEVFAATNNVQPYKYNGKEFDNKNGLNWYDYGARHYDAALGRFVSIDPLSEQDYPSSPYVYCGGNPVIRIDKDGKIWDTVWDIGNMLYDAGAAVAAHIRGDHVSAQSHWVDLGVDAVAAALPFVPAGTTKAIKAADKGVDAVKAAKQVDKASDVTGTAIKDKTLKIEISPENKIDRSLLNPPSKSGNAPTFKQDGTSVEIHHEGQNPNGPFKEMSKQDHRGRGNFKKNHPNLGQPSKIDRKEFEKAKKEYWKKEYEQ